MLWLCETSILRSGRFEISLPILCAIIHALGFVQADTDKDTLCLRDWVNVSHCPTPAARFHKATTVNRYRCLRLLQSFLKRWAKLFWLIRFTCCSTRLLCGFRCPRC